MRWSPRRSRRATSSSPSAATACSPRSPAWSPRRTARSPSSPPAAATTSPGCSACPRTPPSWRRCCSRRTREQVDLVQLTLPGVADKRVVAGSVYCGVDARAGEIVDKAHWLPGALQYPYAALRAMAAYKPGRFLVSVDGDERRFEASNVVVANSAYYGKGMKIAPAARLDDGLLDVVVIEAASKLSLMRSLPKVYDGAARRPAEVTVLTGTRVELRADAARPVPVGGDGEPLGSLPPLSGRTRGRRGAARCALGDRLTAG